MRGCMNVFFSVVMCVVMCCLFDHNAVTNHSRERALLKGAWVCVASENKALNRHQQTGVMWNLRHPAALYCIFHRLTSLTPYSPFFFLLQLLPKTPPAVFISLVLLVALPLCLSLSVFLLWKTITDQLPPLSNWFPLSLCLSSLFSVVLLLWAVHCIYFCLQSFTIFPAFFLCYFFFFFWNFLHHCPPLPPSALIQIPLYPLNPMHTRTKLKHTHHRLSSWALLDPELKTRTLI